MKVDILKESGFCGGVTRALYLLDKLIKDNPGKCIYLLGPIVHNTMVNEGYRSLGVQFISEMDLSKLQDGSFIVISAHGISNNLRAKLSRFNVLDTTCPYVQKNKKLIDENEANAIVFIGRKGHSETKTMTGDNPEIKVVEKEEDLYNFDSHSFGVVFNQTTFNITSLSKLQAMIKERAPFYEVTDTTCTVARSLQESLQTKNETYNTAIIVGDKTSANANSLLEMSPYHPTYFIASSKEVSNLHFRALDSVLIIGSASTPKEELKKVRDGVRAQIMSLQASFTQLS